MMSPTRTDSADFDDYRDQFSADEARRRFEAAKSDSSGQGVPASDQPRYLLIGNFMKTTLHGVKSLYDPNFNHIVAKYADSGLAQTDREVERYLATYRRRIGLEFLRHVIEQRSALLLRRYVGSESAPYRAARRIKYAIRW